MPVVERLIDGKMRVTSGSWDGEKVILRKQVLEVSKVEGRRHVARKPLHHDEGNPQTEPYGPYGISSLMTGMIDQAGSAKWSTAAWSMMNGGASSTWSPRLPSTVPPIG